MTKRDQVDVVTVVRRRAEHNVSRKDMDPDALKVLYRLIRNGYTAYLVGGGVRDLLLGRVPKDFDVATNARPRQLRKLFRNSFLIGRRFRLVHVKFGGNVIETSTFRRGPDETVEILNENLYRSSDNTFGTPEEDAWRRDFTINALFYDIRTYAIVDHVGGLVDLANGIVRSIGDPDVRFQEDPVRMVRAIRFASRLGFKIERKTYQAILRQRELVTHVPPPRLLEEMLRLFPFGAGESAFRLLRRTKVLIELFPEINDFLDRGGRETRLFWAHVDGLDKHTEKTGDGPYPQLLFAVLMYAPLLETLRREGIESGSHDPIARQVLDPISVRFRMPKRIYYGAIQILEGQCRFEQEGARFSKRRFVTQESFPYMLVLREIHLEATGGNQRELQEWRALYAEHRGAATVRTSSSRRGRKRRGRRQAPHGKPNGTP
jgi:poly(A) polymerase